MASRSAKRFVRRFLCTVFLLMFLSIFSKSSFTKRFLHLTDVPTNLPEAKFFREKLPETWYEGLQFDVPETSGERKNWHDYEAMKADARRTGPGENGSVTINTDISMKELENRMSLKNGFNAFVSNMISVNRSVPDSRHENCRNKHYLTNLPTISIVIPCHNEYDTVLKRTLHSIFNRTPKELLKEIIIVDDNSQHGYSIDEMTLYVEEQFPKLVKFIRLPERKGLIYARQRGAKIASGNVLVFFDSHIECNYNWLPPLLEPIAIDDRISTSPIIDTISHKTFKYSGGPKSGWRGGFNWDLRYRHLKLELSDDADRSKPYKDPVMMGGLFAISRRFFWELGGYDDGLDIWGSEQFELSFKIWMCGGMLLVVPCSRVAHIFRGPWKKAEKARNYNFIATNIKRVAEVWMDDYKRYIYEGEPDTYASLNAGDLSDRHALRKNLKCRSFKWFLEVVAPDVLKEFPPIPPPDYANGTLQSVAFSRFCLDTLNGGKNNEVGLFSCSKNLTLPQRNQYWHLTWRNEIQNHRSDLCLDQHESLPNARVHMLSCHRVGGNQYWSYNKKHQWVQHGTFGIDCLEIKKHYTKFRVVVNRCETNNERMRWNFANVNETALELKTVIESDMEN